jgi:flagellar export protein FliJ
MSDRERRFQYRLEPLIRLRSAERDVLKGEMRQAAEEVEKRTREVEQVSREVQAAESELRAALRSGAAIAVDEQQRLQGYLKQRREQREAKQRSLDAASQAMFQVIERLNAKQQDTRALEKHRERQRRQFDQAEARVALNSADDQWLRKRRES